MTRFAPDPRQRSDNRFVNAELWPSIPAVLRVMAGWFLLGIGLLNLAVEADGGLDGAYLIFHVVLAAGGALLLTRRRLIPSRPGVLLGAGAGVAAASAAPLATAARADSESNDEKRKARYQETDHVKTFYRVNRYPAK